MVTDWNLDTPRLGLRPLEFHNIEISQQSCCRVLKKVLVGDFIPLMALRSQHHPTSILIEGVEFLV